MGDMNTTVRTLADRTPANTPARISRINIHFCDEHRRNPSMSYYASEAISVILNMFTIVMVLFTYFMIRTVYDTMNKIKRWLWVLPDGIIRSPIFNDYYQRVFNFLNYRERQTSAYDPVVLAAIAGRIAEAENANFQSPDPAERSTSPAVPVAPAVVVAEVHTQDTPTGDGSSPKTTFRGSRAADGGHAEEPKESLVREMADGEDQDQTTVRKE